MVTVVKLERWALAALLVIGAGFFGFAGAGALRQLWADYKDSADGVYGRHSARVVLAPLERCLGTLALEALIRRRPSRGPC
jgi:hypothetical protein